MHGCPDLRTQYREMVEPEFDAINVWLDTPDRWMESLPTKTVATLESQWGVLQLIDWDRRLRLIEERSI
jgi:hypothetical protein